MVTRSARTEPDRFAPRRIQRIGSVLHDVLGVGGATPTSDPDAEEERAPLLERGRVGLDVTRWRHGQVRRHGRRRGDLHGLRETLAVQAQSGVEPRPRIQPRDPRRQLDDLGGALNTLRTGSESKPGRESPTPLAYSRTTTLSLVEQVAVAPLASHADLGRIDAFVHAFVIGVVSAPRAPNRAGSRLDGQPAQGRVKLQADLRAVVLAPRRRQPGRRDDVRQRPWAGSLVRTGVSRNRRRVGR